MISITIVIIPIENSSLFQNILAGLLEANAFYLYTPSIVLALNKEAIIGINTTIIGIDTTTINIDTTTTKALKVAIIKKGTREANIINR